MVDEPSRSVLICATPRSGSYLLCEALRLTGRAGMPEEFLWHPNAVRFAQDWGVDIEDTRAFRDAMVRLGSSENGVFACKVMWGYAATAARVLHGEPWGDIDDASAAQAAGLVDGLPNTRFVFMRRRDTIGQALSYSRAIQADAWAKFDDGSEVPSDAPVLDPGATVRRSSPGGDLAYDYHQIDYFRSEVEAHNEAWERFFDAHRIEPLLVEYEQLASDFESVALRVLEWLGEDSLGVTFGPRRLQRQRDHISRRWRLRYEEDRLTRELAVESPRHEHDGHRSPAHLRAASPPAVASGCGNT